MEEVYLRISQGNAKASPGGLYSLKENTFHMSAFPTLDGSSTNARGVCGEGIGIVDERWVRSDHTFVPRVKV